MSQETTDQPTQSFLHPAAGGLILGLDWLFFSGTALSGGAGLVVAVVLGFLFGGLGTCLIQRIWGKEPWGRAMLKGLLGGLVVGVPFPIGGTIVGGAILATSGLDQLRARAARALAEKAADRVHSKESEDLRIP